MIRQTGRFKTAMIAGGFSLDFCSELKEILQPA
jgi:hypothetical protein